MKQFGLLFFLGVLSFYASGPVSAFYANGRWTTTASGSVGPIGTPVTLTWSIVPDGTLFQGLTGQSNLIERFDNWFGSGPGGADLTARPWFTHFEQSFERWSELSGMTFVYQAVDDGAKLDFGSTPGNVLAPGNLLSRGDIRFSGVNYDGMGGGYGATWLIPNADITIDTSDGFHFSNANNNYRNFRNTVTHEIGHALGLGHITSSDAGILMEGFFSNAYDGPQFDDIRGIQHQYGDFHEKSNGGAGNNNIANATELGNLPIGNSLTLGADGTTGLEVSILEDDFVSIANSNDFDFYSFTTSSPSLVDIVLSPVGPTYNEQIFAGTTTVNSMSTSNLSLQLYTLVAGSPSLLASVNVNPVGLGESILDFALEEPGEYFVRVAGNAAFVQLYQLSLAAELLELDQPGDFDGDGDIDGADFLAWQRGDSPAQWSAGDLEEWQGLYGMEGSFAATTSVPEPAAFTMFSLAILGFASRSQRALGCSRLLLWSCGQHSVALIFFRVIWLNFLRQNLETPCNRFYTQCRARATARAVPTFAKTHLAAVFPASKRV